MNLTYRTTRGNIKTVLGLVEHTTHRGTKYYTKDDLMYSINTTVQVKNILDNNLRNYRTTGDTLSLTA